MDLIDEFEAIVDVRWDLDVYLRRLQGLLAVALRRGDMGMAQLCLGVLVTCSRQAGRLEQALRYCRRLLRHDPYYQSGWVWASQILIALGRHRSALQCAREGRRRYQEVLSREHQNPYDGALCSFQQVSLQEAVAARLLGRWQEVVEAVDLCLGNPREAVRSDHVGAWERSYAEMLRAEAEWRFDPGQAERLYETAWEYFAGAKRSAVAAAALAVAHHAVGRMEEVREWRKTATDRARTLIGDPFGAEWWQLTFAMLRGLPWDDPCEVAEQSSHD
jgi:tetratricopeptide (TPR) repeat protein